LEKSLQTSKHTVRVGTYWRLVTCFRDFLVSFQPAALPGFQDYTVLSLTPANRQKRSNRTMGSQQPGAWRCPKFPLAPPQPTPRRRAPWATARSAAHSTRVRPGADPRWGPAPAASSSLEGAWMVQGQGSARSPGAQRLIGVGPRSAAGFPAAWPR
jgi:hypothetical protein